jgi:hypothetical protein
MSFRLVCAAFVVLSLVGPMQAQGKSGKPAPVPAPTETTELIRLLQERIETKDFAGASTDLHEVTKLLHEKFAARGKDFPILVNAEAFRAEGTDTEMVPLSVRLPTGPRLQTVSTLLDQLTSQVQATYLIRQGRIEIVPTAYAVIDNLLTQPILARYEQRGLIEVLQDLADRTGATIVLDTRAGDTAKEPITATFRNNATLEDALRICTEAAGLKFVVLRNSVYVTTQANARAIQQEQKQQERQPAPKAVKSAV